MKKHGVKYGIISMAMSFGVLTAHMMVVMIGLFGLFLATILAGGNGTVFNVYRHAELVKPLWLGIPFAIASITLATVSFARHERKPFRITGMALGVIGLLSCLVPLIFAV